MRFTQYYGIAFLLAASAGAQAQRLPTAPGQAAYGAIAEVVRLLEADSTTDWSRVNIEALRQHLIDMDDVTLHAVVRSQNVPGGIAADITGSGHTVGAIQRMWTMHSSMLALEMPYVVTTADIGDGVHTTVVAKDPSDARAAARIRGLGIAGLLTEGDHHPRHHLALARGEAMAHGK